MKTTFTIKYGTSWGESVSVVLNDRKYPLSWTEGNVWRGTADVPASALSDYWYVIMRDGLVKRTEWSHHCAKADGRRKSMEISDTWIDCPIPGCIFPRAHRNPSFDRPGFRGAGTAIPVFSLRTEEDFGIGEFHDLHPLIDWVAATGQCIIQLLPVTDTTRKGDWKDSYPYSPISSFALHPLYIHLQDLGIRETAAFKKEQDALNALPELDYPRVFKAKMEYLRKAFAKNGAADISSPAYSKFCKDNENWLPEYSEFCARRDSDDKDFHCWIQFHLDRQFRKEVEYARKKGVSFKGDLPIGVSGDSADAYWHPELFNLDSSTGAPPDFFSTDGQNWGFPTYNWEEMAKDDYAWWKARLRHMSRYFDAFRIDHILGFFRIWEIPGGQASGKMGHFNPAIPFSSQELAVKGLPIEGLFLPDPRHPGMYQPMISPDTSSLDDRQKSVFDALYTDFFFHRHNEFWRWNAERKLPELLSATGMLACGEDLGMMPDCVPGVMDEQKILSLEMANMEKGRPWPYLSVCATSSHDMSTMRMQHMEAGNKEDLRPWEVYNILWDHLKSESMLAIFPLQDWVAMDPGLRRKDLMNERINEPGDPNHHWRYRFHTDLHRLSSSPKFVAEITGLLKDSERFVR